MNRTSGKGGFGATAGKGGFGASFKEESTVLS